MCIFFYNILIIIVEWKPQIRFIYVSFVEHKFIEQAFGNVYIEVVGFTTVFWKVPIFRQILVQQNNTAAFLAFVCTCGWMTCSECDESTCSADLSLQRMDVQFKEMYLRNWVCHWRSTSWADNQTYLWKFSFTFSR